MERGGGGGGGAGMGHPEAAAVRRGEALQLLNGASRVPGDLPGTCMTCKTRASLQRCGAGWVLACGGQNDLCCSGTSWELRNAQENFAEALNILILT